MSPRYEGSGVSYAPCLISIMSRAVSRALAIACLLTGLPGQGWKDVTPTPLLPLRAPVASAWLQLSRKAKTSVGVRLWVALRSGDASGRRKPLGYERSSRRMTTDSVSHAKQFCLLRFLPQVNETPENHAPEYARPGCPIRPYDVRSPFENGTDSLAAALTGTAAIGRHCLLTPIILLVRYRYWT
ncbi:hypothetical protein ABIB06_007839 [Bradyrhizobium sp. LB8.2]